MLQVLLLVKLVAYSLTETGHAWWLNEEVSHEPHSKVCRNRGKDSHRDLSNQTRSSEEYDHHGAEGHVSEHVKEPQHYLAAFGVEIGLVKNATSEEVIYSQVRESKAGCFYDCNVLELNVGLNFETLVPLFSFEQNSSLNMLQAFSATASLTLKVRDFIFVKLQLFLLAFFGGPLLAVKLEPV